MKTAEETWHRHLDTCERCREKPFDLCLIGQIWLKKAAEEAIAILKGQAVELGERG